MDKGKESRSVPCRTLVALALPLAWLVPAPSQAETPVARSVLYEVNEALTFLKSRQHGGRPDSAAVARRLAKASLLGLHVEPVVADSVFSMGTFMAADAVSALDVNTNKGPIVGSFSLLADLDPTRESLDTLEVKAKGWVRGDLDLTTAGQGYASLTGRWGTRSPMSTGTMRGVFLIPFQVEGDDQSFFYNDLGLDGPGSLCHSTSGACLLAPDEFSLGIPLTKLVVQFSE